MGAQIKGNARGKNNLWRHFRLKLVMRIAGIMHVPVDVHQSHFR
mgnify:CR=1 FL=1